MQKTQQTFELSNHVCLELPSEIYEKNGQVLRDSERAILLINIAEAYSSKVIADLKKIKGIGEVYPLKGSYDIIAFVEAESFEKLKERVFNQIRGISNIKGTLTLTLINDPIVPW